MTTWSVALVLAVVVTIFATPSLRGWAFDAGWFERSTETRRSRAERRPTHGGLVLGAAVLVGGILGGVDEGAVQATAAALAIALVAAHRAERGKGTVWEVRGGRLAAALVVPALGVRAELTGTTAIDVLLTALAVLAIIVGLDSIEQSDGVSPAVAAVAALGLLAVAVRVDDPAAPLLAALVGAGAGTVAHAWPPAAVRIGRIGPIVAGTALAAAAIEVSPEVTAPRSALVPVLALCLVATAAVVPRLDRRLRRRGLPPHVVLPIVAGLGAFAADALARGAMEPVAAAALAGVPAALVGLVGLVTPVPSTASATPGGPTVSPRRSAPLALVGLAAVAMVGGSAVFAALSLRTARDAMEAGREAAIDGLDAARAGDLETAQARFRVADDRFADAESRLDNPLIRLGDLVPGVAQNLRGARTLADVGSDLAGTAVAVAERAGADDLRMTGGQFPVDAAREVGEQLGIALTTLGNASSRLTDVDSPYLYGELREGAATLAQRVAEATRSIEVAAQATKVAPALLGADGDRRWMVAIMTPSELRGAGGLIGDFAELRTSNGKVDFVRAIPARELNAVTDRGRQAKVLPPVYLQSYSGFAPDRFWQNLSVTPDVATMSQAIAGAFPLTAGGATVDGVIAIDPLGLAALLQLTGPVRVPTWPVPITADNAVEVLLFEHYDELEGEVREAFQAQVVGAVVEALTADALPTPSAMAATLSAVVAGGHLRLWSPDAEAQSLFRRVGLDGELRAPGQGDFVQLVTQNGSESKIDWYLRRSLTYEATVDPGTGSLEATATVRLTNEAPAGGVSDYIIGEVGGPTRPGVSRVFTTIYTHHRPVEVTDEAGRVLPVSLAQENGFFAITVLLDIEPGATATVRYRLRGAVPRGSAYRLDVGHQATIRPDRVEVAVVAAPGWAVAEPAGGLAPVERDGPSTFDVSFRGTGRTGSP